MAPPLLVVRFVTLSILLIHLVQGRGFDRRTEVGCQGSVVNVRCEEGEAVSAVRANFGRFSSEVCNEEGVQGWSVTCMNPKTLRVVKERCQGRESCSLPVETEVFGDACPGTDKYLEIIYVCEKKAAAGDDGETQTSSPVAPWLRDLSATPPTTAKPTTTTTTTTTTEAPKTEEEIFEEFDLIVEDVDPSENYEDEEVVVEFPEEPLGHCAPITERNLFWNWTRAGQEAIQLCPPGSSGFARWGCNEDGHWSSQYPNLAECQSHWLRRLESEFDANSLGAISSRLAEFTGASVLYGGDLHSTVRLLKRLPERLGQELPTLQSQRAMEHETTVLRQRLTRIASDLLDQAQMLAWQDLPTDRRASLASALFLSVVESNMLAAEVLNREDRIKSNTTNVLADVRVRGARHVQDQYLSDPHNDHFVVVAGETLAESSSNGAVRVGFFNFFNLEYVLPGLDNHFINSQVVGASIPDAPSGRIPDSSRPLLFSLRHKVADGEARNPLCAAWDYSAASWTTEGCRLLKTTPTHTTCECRRLSQYAVLMEATPSASPQAAAEGSSQDGEDDPYYGLILAGACLIVALTVFSLTMALLYAKKTDRLGSKACESFYPPLASNSSSSNQDSRIYKSTGDDVARQLQARPPPNVIFNHADNSKKKPRTMIPFAGNVEQLYAHIYSEIDPAYAAYLANAAAANAAAHGNETSSETFSSSDGSVVSRGSPTFHQPTLSQVALLEDQVLNAQHLRQQSLTLRPPPQLLPGTFRQVPQPQQPVSAITLQDGDQLVRLRLEDPYTIEPLVHNNSHRQFTNEHQQHQQCFQV